MNGELVKTVEYGLTATGVSSRGREEGEGEEREGLVGGDCTYSLEQLAYLRSGDKGNTANIGILHCIYMHVCTCTWIIYT